jgi:hypothetical protein
LTWSSRRVELIPTPYAAFAQNLNAASSMAGHSRNVAARTCLRRQTRTSGRRAVARPKHGALGQTHTRVRRIRAALITIVAERPIASRTGLNATLTDTLAMRTVLVPAIEGCIRTGSPDCLRRRRTAHR